MTTSDDGPPLPPGVKRQWKILADSTRKAYHYHRATGRPLPGEPGSLQFTAAYRQAERPAARLAAPERERFTALLEEFLRSPEHVRLTQRVHPAFLGSRFGRLRRFGRLLCAY